MATTPTPPPPRPVVLNSWKEIASYLGRGVRTAQRYELECELPVWRINGKTRSVLAFPKDLDDWLRRTQLHSLDPDTDRDQHSSQVLQCHQEAISRLECSLQLMNERLAEGRWIRCCKRWFD